MNIDLRTLAISPDFRDDDLEMWTDRIFGISPLGSVAVTVPSPKLKGKPRRLDIDKSPSTGPLVKPTETPITPTAADDIVRLWALLHKNPFRVLILKQLRQACHEKFGVMFPDISLLYFAWLCSLSFLSRKFCEWGMGKPIGGLWPERKNS